MKGMTCIKCRRKVAKVFAILSSITRLKWSKKQRKLLWNYNNNNNNNNNNNSNSNDIIII